MADTAFGGCPARAREGARQVFSTTVGGNMTGKTTSQVRVKHDDLYWVDEYLPLEVSDDELRQRINGAELPVLLAALAVALKDGSILAEDLKPPLPPIGAFLKPHGGMDETQQAKAREVAFSALQRLREQDVRSVETLPQNLSDQILDWFTAGKIEDEAFAGQIKHEFSLAPDKNGSTDWQFSPDEYPENFEVLVVGAGISGIAAAWRLQEAEVPFTWIEGSHTIGGTWWKNNYPGVRLDTPTYGYSFSFAQKTDWPHQ